VFKGWALQLALFLARLFSPGHEFRDHYGRSLLRAARWLVMAVLFFGAFGGAAMGFVALALKFEPTANVVRWIWMHLEPTSGYMWTGVMIGWIVLWSMGEALLYCLSYPASFVTVIV